MRGAEIEPDHFLARTKIRLKIKRSKKTKKRELKNWDIGKLNREEAKEELIKEVAANIQNTKLEEKEDINEIWNKTKKRSKRSSWQNNRTRKEKKKDHKKITGLIKNVK